MRCAYLDYAEMQAQNRKVMAMQDWVQKLNAFLQFNERELLDYSTTSAPETCGRLGTHGNLESRD